MDHSDDLTPGDTALAHEAQGNHTQCQRQRMREVSAVDHSDDLAPEMQQWNMKLNSITYSAAISACEKGQQWIPATTLLQEMFDPNTMQPVRLAVHSSLCH